MHEVEVARLALDLGTQHIAYERAELGREVVLLQAFEGAGRDVVDRDARLRVDDGLLVARGGSGEDLDLDASGSQLARELEDVHVHSARVTVAGLFER